MNPGVSYMRHSVDITNILSRFTEKYLHQLDRSSVDSLLQDGRRLVGDLTDLELEYLGFSLINQLIWISFSAHNSYLRSSQDKPKDFESPANIRNVPTEKKEQHSGVSNRRSAPKSILKSPQKSSLQHPSIKTITSQPKSPSKTNVEQISPCHQAFKPKFEPKSPPKANLRPSDVFNPKISSKGSFSVIPQRDVPDIKPHTLGSQKQLSKIRGSSILELPPTPSVLAPETPELLSSKSSHQQPLLSIPETEYPNFTEEEDSLEDKRRSPPGSPILSSKTCSLDETMCEDKLPCSPSILSNRRQKENKWGIPTDAEERCLPPKRESLKQGSLQSYLRPSQKPSGGDLKISRGGTSVLSSLSSFEPSEHLGDDPVRTKAGRAHLEGFDCPECKAYYKDSLLSQDTVKKLLKACSRHRAKVPPPSSDESQNERWELMIRDDEEEDERNKTQMGPPLKVRKKRKGSLR